MESIAVVLVTALLWAKASSSPIQNSRRDQQLNRLEIVVAGPYSAG